METPNREKVLRRIVANHQAEKVEGVLVDAFTASMLVKVMDGLHKPENKTSFLNMPIVRMVDIGWKLVS